MVPYYYFRYFVEVADFNFGISDSGSEPLSFGQRLRTEWINAVNDIKDRFFSVRESNVQVDPSCSYSPLLPRKLDHQSSYGTIT